MVALHGSKARLFLSGFDVSRSMREGSFPMSVDLADSSTWGMTSKRYTSSERVEGTFAGSGVWEHTGLTATSIDDLLHTKLGGKHVATYVPSGDSFGARARIIGGVETAFELDSPGDDITGFNFELASESGVNHRARVLQPLAGALNITTGGNGAGLDELGAAGTTEFGAAAALHVVSKGGGAGTLTVKFQHSTDGSVWVDLITFTGVTAAGATEYIEIAGQVRRHFRALWTLTGGTWDIHVAAGRR